MDSKGNYFEKSMDDIVFDNRNKSYGAFFLRVTYQKHLLKALAISISVFVFGLYTPKMAKSIGLFSEDQAEQFDTTSIVLSQPPSLKPDEPPPPPPPEPVEIIRPTERFLEMLAVEKEKAIEPPPPTIDELENKDIGNKKVEGDPTNEPPPVVDEIVTNVVDDKVYVDVDQKARFIGGDDALDRFLRSHLIYPEAAKAYEITGEAEVYFVVNIDGRVTDVKISRHSGNADLDAEAIRVVKLFNNKFEPGKNNGKAVRTACRIPITFELEEE